MQYKKVYLEITNNCNLKCPFCIQNKRLKEFMNKDSFLVILSKLKPYTNYLYFHILGEPLLHPYVNEFIDLAHENGFFVNITTNGYFIDKIKDNYNIRQINISLHSFDESYPVSLDKYLHNIFETVDVLCSKGTYVSFRLWTKNKYNSKIIKTINDYYQVNLKENVQQFTIRNRIFVNNFHQFVWPDMENTIYEEEGICYALKDHIGILVDGTIIPCCLDTAGIIKLGNIFNDNLDTIISSKRYQKMLEGFHNHKKCEELCKHCKFLDTK